MANLRVNEITTGIGSYHGSIYASGTGAYLHTTATAPGTDDFTIEFYINSDNASGSNQEGVFAINGDSDGFQTGSSNQFRLVQGRDGSDGQNGGLEVDINGTSVGTGDGNDIIQEGTWHHVAVTRASGTVKIWVDGVEKASGSAAGDVTGTTFITGYYDSGYTYQGFMSNFRYRKGTAHYTTTFTAPTKPLERTSDTELIFAQSPHNAGNGFSSAIHEGITDIMSVNGNVTANELSPTQLSDTSGVGVVYDGPIKHNTQGYMYFPTGRTDERGRGRGVFGGGGISSPSNPANISYINVQSQGNTTRFGSLTTSNRTWTHGYGSSTRAIWSNGGNTSGSSYSNTIDFVTIATTSNAIDFGDSTIENTWRGGFSNSIRGITGGGGPSAVNTIDFITIATTANAQDFGDLSAARRGVGAMASSTRGVFAGGVTPSYVNTMDFVTIATTGNASDFGDMTQASRHDSGGCSSGTRGIIGGGQTPTALNTIQFITIASTGDASDFGDLQQTQVACGTLDNSIRGVFSGSYSPMINTMSFITIATTGNSSDFGDNTDANYAMGGTSDSHGGLS